MTDKEKIREEVERLKSNLIHGACASQIAMETRCKEEAYNEVLAILDSLQEEPVSDDLEKIVEEIAEPTILNAYGTKELARRLRSTICGTSVSEDLEEELDSYIKDNFTIDKEQLDRFGIEEKDYMYSMDKIDILTMVRYFTNLQKEKDIEIITDVEAVAFANGMAQMKKQIEEFVSEDLGEYINELSKQFPEVSFAKLSRIAVRVSRWQRNQDVKNKLPKVINRTDLDEYAYQCAYDMSNDWAIENPTWHDVEDACKLGANWQKEQMMAKAIDGDVTFDYYGDDDKTYGCIAQDSFCLEDFGLKDGDKVKVIVIKED